MKSPKGPLRFLGYTTLAMVLLAAAVVFAPSDSAQQIRTADIDVDTIEAAARAKNKNWDKKKSTGKRCEPGIGCGNTKKRGGGVLRVSDADNDSTADASTDTSDAPKEDGIEPTDSVSTDPEVSQSDTGNLEDSSSSPTTLADGEGDTTVSQQISTSSGGDGGDDSSSTTESGAETTLQSSTGVVTDGSEDELSPSDGSGDQTTTSAQATTAQQVTTTQATTTTTTTGSTAATTTSSDADNSCCAEGYAGVHVDASSSFDKWTEGDEYWPFINANYAKLTVYGSYWDSRLEHYDRVIVYRETGARSTRPTSATLSSGRTSSRN